MRVLASFVSVVAVVVLIGAGSAQDKKGAVDDAKKFQGTWSVVSVDEKGSDAKVVIKGDRLTVYEGKQKEEVIFKLDPSKNPKQIDMKQADGPGDNMPGIYELDGDNLKLCYVEKGERPTKFAVDPSRRPAPAFVVLKRQK